MSCLTLHGAPALCLSEGETIPNHQDKDFEPNLPWADWVISSLTWQYSHPIRQSSTPSGLAEDSPGPEHHCPLGGKVTSRTPQGRGQWQHFVQLEVALALIRAPVMWRWWRWILEWTHFRRGWSRVGLSPRPGSRGPAHLLWSSPFFLFSICHRLTGIRFSSEFKDPQRSKGTKRLSVHSISKEGQSQRMFELPPNFTHFTC